MKLNKTFYGSLVLVASATLIFLNAFTVEKTGNYTPRTLNASDGKRKHSFDLFDNILDQIY